MSDKKNKSSNKTEEKKIKTSKKDKDDSKSVELKTNQAKAKTTTKHSKTARSKPVKKASHEEEVLDKVLQNQKKQEVSLEKILHNPLTSFSVLAANSLILLILFVLTIVNLVQVFEINKENQELREELITLEKDLQSTESYMQFAQVQQGNLIETLSPVLEQLPQQQPEPETVQNLNAPDLQNEILLGSEDSKYIWIKYSDVQCPFCQQMHPDIKRIPEEKTNWSVVYRHYPLEQLHPGAEDYSQILSCTQSVDGNDAFWTMLDEVYAQGMEKSDLDTNTFIKIAEEKNLNSNRINDCYKNGDIKNQVKSEINQNISVIGSAGFGTPTGVMFNTETQEHKIVVGAIPFEQMLQEMENFEQGSGMQ